MRSYKNITLRVNHTSFVYS